MNDHASITIEEGSTNVYAQSTELKPVQSASC